MRFPRLRLSVRALVELVALAAVALGFRDVWRETQPPRPALDALRRGDEARRVAALRDLSLTGPAGVEAIPDLIRTSRADPAPAVRRGAVHALTMIALEDAGEGLALDAVLAGPPTPRPRPMPGRAGLKSPHVLRPGVRGDRLGPGLVEVMRSDPDPSVRVYAVRALRKVLNGAVDERARAKAGLGGPAWAYVAEGPWVVEAARAVAEQARDPDPQVRGHAAGILVGSRAGAGLLSKAEQIGALRRFVEDDAPPGVPAGVDLAALNRLASLMVPDHPDSPRLIELLLRRRANPPLIGVSPGHRDGMAGHARGGYDRILWSLAGSVQVVRRHPQMLEILGAMLSGDPEAYNRAANGGEWLIDQVSAMTADQHRSDPSGGESASWSGPFKSLPEPYAATADAVARDPRLLGLLWPRVDRPGRLGWLAGGGKSWEALFPILADRRARPDIPPEESAAIFDRWLDEPAPTAAESSANGLRRLAGDVKRARRGQDPRGFAIPPLEAARQIRTLRGLAVAAYFVRGAGARARSVGRLVDRLRDRLASPEPAIRRQAAMLLGSLGEAAIAAVPALQAQADQDKDDDARGAAAAALRAAREHRDDDP